MKNLEVEKRAGLASVEQTRREPPGSQQGHRHLIQPQPLSRIQLPQVVHLFIALPVYLGETGD